MNPTKAIKRARRAIRQADSALKDAANTLRKQAQPKPMQDMPEPTPAADKPEFLSKSFNLPAEPGSNGLAAAANALRKNGPRAFRIGDEIEATHLLGRLRFTVIGIDCDKAPGRDHCLTLMLTSLVLGSAFDAPDLDHPWGRNHWANSYIRAMLDGKFLDGFSDNDRQVMAVTQRPTYSFNEQETIYTDDVFFLLSASEAGFEVNGNDVRDEGSAYPYFKAGNEARQLTDAKGTARYWWLRSPNPWNGGNVRNVTPSGALDSSNAYHGYAVAAACVIG